MPFTASGESSRKPVFPYGYIGTSGYDAATHLKPWLQVSSLTILETSQVSSNVGTKIESKHKGVEGRSCFGSFYQSENTTKKS